MSIQIFLVSFSEKELVKLLLGYWIHNPFEHCRLFPQMMPSIPTKGRVQQEPLGFSMRMNLLDQVGIASRLLGRVRDSVRRFFSEVDGKLLSKNCIAFLRAPSSSSSSERETML